MPKSKPASAKKDLHTVVIDDPADSKGELRNLGGSKSDKWNLRIANQVFRSAWLGHSDDAQKLTDIEAVTVALTGIGPRNELEGMLGAQLIAAHNAAMESYRRAMLPEQTFAGREQSLLHAARLSKTFASLLDTLHRQRGNAQQKVVVEHVHVHPGGQAVVGLVNGPGGGSTPQVDGQPHAPQLADARQPPLLPADEERDVAPGAHGAEQLG